MSSVPNPLLSAGDPMGTIEATPFQEILSRSKEGSVEHLRQMSGRIKHEYSNYAQEVIDAISANLMIPDDGQVTYLQLVAAVTSFSILLEVADWYRTGNTAPISPKALTSNTLAEGYLFWARMLLGVPLSQASTDSILESGHAKPGARLALYNVTAIFFQTLFTIPSITYASFPPNLKPALLDVAIALWVVLIDGELPIYPEGLAQERPESEAEPTHALVAQLCKSEGKAFADAVIAHRICTPRVFVQRTIGRMRALGDLNKLPHLSDLQDITIDILSMTATLEITDVLMYADRRLELTFVKERSAGTYVNVMTSQAEKIDKALNEGTGEWGRRQKGADYIFAMLQCAVFVVSGVVGQASVSVLQQMEDVMANGGLRLLALSEAAPPSNGGQNGGPWGMLDFATMVAPYLEVFPTVYDDMMRYIVPHVPSDTADVAGVHGFRAPRYPHIALDIEAMKTMSTYVNKENRVRICDNLKHYDRLGELSTTLTSQEEHACSRCHSVVYCSVKCQQEDWSAFHRSECKEMAKIYTDREAKGNAYSYHNRTFQTSILRHAFESSIHTFDTAPSVISSCHGRDGVAMVDCYRPQNNIARDPKEFVPTELLGIPNYLQRRFHALVKEFTDARGGVAGGRGRRLLSSSFCFGDEDVTLLILLRRVDSTSLPAPAKPRSQPEGKSSFVVQGVITYMGMPRLCTKKRDMSPDEVDRFLPSSGSRRAQGSVAACPLM